MEKHIIQEELKNCPGIVYYPGMNMLEMVGRSIPENPDIIYTRLDDWITEHFERNNSLDLNFQLDYINSGSSKNLYEILKKLTAMSRSGKRIRMKWKYEEDDEAMLDLGQHFRDTAGIPLDLEKI
jgi:hypothetical protein